MWDWTPPHYEGSQENIYYPDWAHQIGWFLTLVTALQIPIVAIFMVIYYGAKGKIREVNIISKEKLVLQIITQIL